MNSIELIRNFCVIAHIDHGKSTLADRFLELTSQRKIKEGQSRIMDTLDIEQERGITIKMQSARMIWKDHILNLIDTPGHIDFSYEVSRSVVASEGALLLVDAKQGIQAQTISNARLAKEHGLEIIPVISKIDLPNIDIVARKKEISSILGFHSNDIFCVSGKTGEGVEELLDAINIFIPSPKSRKSDNVQALIYDSIYDEYRGIILLVRVFGGDLKKGDTVYLSADQDGKTYKMNIEEVGYVLPELSSQIELKAGEVGYIITGIKVYNFPCVGKTILSSISDKPIYSYKKPLARIFASVFPVISESYTQLRDSINKLSLNDPSIEISSQRSELLGTGFKIGFLGLLHMEVFQERLEREFNSELIVTSPSVKYRVRTLNNETKEIETVSDFIEPNLIQYYEEPYVRVEILTTIAVMSNVMNLCNNRRCTNLTVSSDEKMSDVNYIKISYDMPLAEIVSGFFDKLKSVSRGFASMDYYEIGYKKVDLVKVSVLVNKQEIIPLSFLEVRENARNKATSLIEVLKKTIPRHQFEVPLQAAIGSNIIARENIKAFRKDVLHKLHASDPSRRAKLLSKQKKGKERMKLIGKVNIPQEAFLSILKV